MSTPSWQRYPICLSLGALMAMFAGGARGYGAEESGDTAFAVTTLAACPNRPSCVVSRDDAGARAVAALTFEGSAADALARLSNILKNMPRTEILTSDPHYLHATQETRLLHFTDDVEFLLDPQTGRIDVRSCSRVGYYDFGVNRARIEAIRDAFNSPQ